MRIRDGIKLNFDDVLLVPQRSTLKSRKDVVLDREFQFYHSPKKLVCKPIFSSNMYATGSMQIGRELAKENMLTCLHKFYTREELVSFFSEDDKYKEFVFVSIGQSMKDVDKIVELGFEPNIRIDVANGNREEFVDFCKTVRVLFPNSIIGAGNVCTSEMTQELIIHGKADIIFLGIGPGSQCETRKLTGCGYPQLSTIMECASVAHGLKSADKKIGLVCGDGGCKTVGDVCKGFGAGADFIMLGGFFAGADECLGEWVEDTMLGMSDYTLDKDSKPVFYSTPSIKYNKRLKFYGMSSLEAQNNHNGGMEDYRASEGKVSEIPYKGPISGLIKELLGGIRSSCTYIGSTGLKDFSKCTEFVRVK